MNGPTEFKRGDIVILDELSDQDAYRLYGHKLTGGVYIYMGPSEATHCIILRPHPFLNCGSDSFLCNYLGEGFHFLSGAKISLVCKGGEG